MDRIVIRPRVQIFVLVVVFGVFGLIGVAYFTNGDVFARRDWFGLILGIVLPVGAAVGIWRTLGVGVVIDATGVRVRSGVDARDQVIPWSKVRSVDCAQVDIRGGLPIYGPVISLGEGELPILALGSYSQQDAQRKVEQLRRLMEDKIRP